MVRVVSHHRSSQAVRMIIILTALHEWQYHHSMMLLNIYRGSFQNNSPFLHCSTDWHVPWNIMSRFTRNKFDYVTFFIQCKIFRLLLIMWRRCFPKFANKFGQSQSELCFLTIHMNSTQRYRSLITSVQFQSLNQFCLFVYTQYAKATSTATNHHGGDSLDV